MQLNPASSTPETPPMQPYFTSEDYEKFITQKIVDDEMVKEQTTNDRTHQRIYNIAAHITPSTASLSLSTLKPKKAHLPGLDRIVELVEHLKIHLQSLEEVNRVVYGLEKVISSRFSTQQLTKDNSVILDVVVRRIRATIEEVTGSLERRGFYLPPRRIFKSSEGLYPHPKGNFLLEIAKIFDNIVNFNSSPRAVFFNTTYESVIHEIALLILASIAIDNTVDSRIPFITLMKQITEDKNSSDCRRTATLAMASVLTIISKERNERTIEEFNKGFETLFSSTKGDDLIYEAIKLVTFANSRQDFTVLTSETKNNIFRSLLDRAMGKLINISANSLENHMEEQRKTVRLIGDLASKMELPDSLSAVIHKNYSSLIEMVSNQDAPLLKRNSAFQTLNEFALQIKIPDDLFVFLIKMFQNEVESNDIHVKSMNLIVAAVLGGQELPENIRKLLVFLANNSSNTKVQSNAIYQIAKIVKHEQRTEGKLFNLIVEIFYNSHSKELQQAVAKVLVEISGTNSKNFEIVSSILLPSLNEIDKSCPEAMLMAIKQMAKEQNKIDQKIICSFQFVLEKLIKKSTSSSNWNDLINVTHVLKSIAVNCRENQFPEGLVDVLVRIAYLHYDSVFLKEELPFTMGLPPSEGLGEPMEAWLGEHILNIIMELALNSRVETEIDYILNSLKKIVNDDVSDATFLRFMSISMVIAHIVYKKKPASEMEKLIKHKNAFIRNAAESVKFKETYKI